MILRAAPSRIVVPRVVLTAMHEASHSCVAEGVVGRPVSTVSLSPRVDANRVILSPHCLSLGSTRTEEQRERAAIFLLAGLASDERVGRLSWRRATTDIVEAARLIPDERRLLDIWRTTRRIVGTEWPSIAAVARVLLRERTLDGKDVRRIIDRTKRRTA